MANRYWVGGTGNWSSTSRWSASSGGSSGASIPGSGDDVFFDGNSNTGTGSFTVTIDTSARLVRNFTASGLDGAMTLAGSQHLYIYGSLSLPATNFTWSHTGQLHFANTSSSKTIQTNGKTISSSTVNFGANSSPDTWTLLDALTCTNYVYFVGGTFDADAYNVTASGLTISGSNTKQIRMGSGTWTLTAAGTVWNYSGSNFTLQKGTAVLYLSNTTTSSRTLALGGFDFYELRIGGATGISATTISGNNSFDIVSSTKVVAHTLNLTAGSTQTIAQWTITGSAGNVVTVYSTSAVADAYVQGLSQPLESIDYLSVRRLSAANDDQWYVGGNSADVGNNTNVYFDIPPTRMMPFF